MIRSVSGGGEGNSVRHCAPTSSAEQLVVLPRVRLHSRTVELQSEGSGLPRLMLCVLHAQGALGQRSDFSRCVLPSFLGGVSGTPGAVGS